MNSAIKGQSYRRFMANSFVKFHVKKNWELNMIVFYPNLCYKGTAMCFLLPDGVSSYFVSSGGVSRSFTRWGVMLT